MATTKKSSSTKSSTKTTANKNTKKTTTTNTWNTGNADIYLNTNYVNAAIEDLTKIGDAGIATVKSDVNAKVVKLNAVLGFSEYVGGSINPGAFDEVIEYGKQGINALINEIEEKSELIQAFSKGEKDKNKTKNIVLKSKKTSEGSLSVLEYTGDDCYSTASWGLSRSSLNAAAQSLSNTSSDDGVESYTVNDLISNTFYFFGTAAGAISMQKSESLITGKIDFTKTKTGIPKATKNVTEVFESIAEKNDKKVADYDKKVQEEISSLREDDLDKKDESKQDETQQKEDENIVKDPNPAVVEEEPVQEQKQTGGGYNENEGYVPKEEPKPEPQNETQEVKEEPVEQQTEETPPLEDSLEDIINNSEPTTVKIEKPVSTGSKSSGSSAIPIAAGLTAAAAAGIGAKAFMDRKNNNNNDDDDDLEDWSNEDTTEIEYDEGIEKEKYLDDELDSSFEEEKYGARTNDELADLQ